MIYSVIPHEIIFGSEISGGDISYVRKNGIIMEVADGKVRRIISTDPKDFIGIPYPEFTDIP